MFTRRAPTPMPGDQHGGLLGGDHPAAHRRDPWQGRRNQPTRGGALTSEDAPYLHCLYIYSAYNRIFHIFFIIIFIFYFFLFFSYIFFDIFGVKQNTSIFQTAIFIYAMNYLSKFTLKIYLYTQSHVIF